MARTPRDVTDAELNVMQVLWQHGATSVRVVVRELYEEPTNSQTASVQTLLARLERKGYVQRQRDESGVTFRARVDREELIGRRLQGIAEELCEGSLGPLLAHLVQKQKLSPDELQSLRELIDELDQ